MCYNNGVPVIGLKELAAYGRRWNNLQANMVVESLAVNQHAPTIGGEEGARLVDGGSKTQYCLCSPTRHPGSFRCRQHRGQYVWGGGDGRVVKTRSDN